MTYTKSSLPSFSRLLSQRIVTNSVSRVEHFLFLTRRFQSGTLGSRPRRQEAVEVARSQRQGPPFAPSPPPHVFDITPRSPGLKKTRVNIPTSPRETVSDASAPSYNQSPRRVALLPDVKLLCSPLYSIRTGAERDQSGRGGGGTLAAFLANISTNRVGP